MCKFSRLLIKMLDITCDVLNRTSVLFFHGIVNFGFHRSNLLWFYNSFFLFFWCWGPTRAGILILEVSRSHATTHHSRQDFSGRVISPSQRPLPNNTWHSTQIDIHAPGRVRTHNPSKRAAVDPRLRQCGHWDRLWFYNTTSKLYSYFFLCIFKTTALRNFLHFIILSIFCIFILIILWKILRRN